MWKIYFSLLLCTCVYGITDEEVKAEFVKLVMRCLPQHPVEMSEMVQMQSLVAPKSKEGKCLLACAYKLDGSLNEKGLYDIERAYKIAEITSNGDEKRKKNAKKLSDICAKINDVSVSDGEKGCDRADLLFKCIVENAPKLGFKV